VARRGGIGHGNEGAAMNRSVSTYTMRDGSTIEATAAAISHLESAPTAPRTIAELQAVIAAAYADPDFLNRVNASVPGLGGAVRR
jgi:hypothetical protein